MKRLNKSLIPPRSIFPGSKFVRNLRRIQRPTDLGEFNFDGVWLVPSEPLQHFERWFVSIEKTDKFGELKGCIKNGRRFQAYVNKKKRISVMVNPRHFSSWSEMIVFISSLMNINKARPSRVDFSFLIYRHLVSVDFLLWCIGVDGPSYFKLIPYEDKNHAFIAGARYCYFAIGKSKTMRVKVYDPDAKRYGESKGRQEHSVTGKYNLEIGVGPDRLCEYGIQNIWDLQKTGFRFIFDKLSFVDPTRCVFDRTKFNRYKRIWKTRGFYKFRKKCYLPSKRYDEFDRCTRTLQIKGMAFAQALVQLARNDLEIYLRGHHRLDRRRPEPLAFEMPILFAFPKN